MLILNTLYLSGISNYPAGLMSRFSKLCGIWRGGFSTDLSFGGVPSNFGVSQNTLAKGLHPRVLSKDMTSG